MAAKEKKTKVRMRSKLPTAMSAQDWLNLVLKEKPARNVLGALAFAEKRELCVIGWLGRQVHAVPFDKARAGSVFHNSLSTDEERTLLDAWLADVDAGKFDALINAEKAKWVVW